MLFIVMYKRNKYSIIKKNYIQISALKPENIQIYSSKDM